MAPFSIVKVLICQLNSIIYESMCLICNNVVSKIVIFKCMNILCFMHESTGVNISEFLKSFRYANCFSFICSFICT